MPQVSNHSLLTSSTTLRKEGKTNTGLIIPHNFMNLAEKGSCETVGWMDGWRVRDEDNLESLDKIILDGLESV